MEEAGSVLIIYPHGDPLDLTSTGGQNRIYHLIEQASREWKVVVLCPECGSESVPESVSIEIYPPSASSFMTDFDVGFARALPDILSRYEIDLVHIAYPSGILTTRAILQVRRRDVPIVYDAHDVMSVRVREMNNDNLGVVGNLAKRVYTPILEKSATRFVDHAIVVSENDRGLLASETGMNRGDITVVPNGADPVNSEKLTPPGEVRSKLGFDDDDILAVFHGNYESGYHNREATELIINELGPKFETLNSDVRFVVAGKNVPEYESTNVSCVGFVDDLYSFLNAADLAVVPLLSGTATKLKIFDYLSVGIPIVTTQKGSEGIQLKHGESALITETVDTRFVKYVDELSRNQKKKKSVRMVEN